jgi:hypothetical protein
MPHPKGADPAVVKLVRESRFVFTGTIEQEGFSSLSFVPAAPTTSVVRVERVHHATPALHNQVGQRVTVVSAEGSTPPRDKRRVFFTNPFLYGETIAVREVANLDTPEDLNELHAMVAHVAEESKVEELREHLASAQAVVEGRVAAVRRAYDVPVSEHDPLWWVAVIRVARPLKGDLKGEIRVRFPGSRDIKWYGVPKLKEGDEGVFVLHRDGLELAEAALAILHPGDFAPAESEEARRLVEQIRPRSPRQ